jgi:hypothetical protein
MNLMVDHDATGVDALDLLAAVEVQACLPLVDFPRGDAAFSFHLPHRRDDQDTLGYFVPGHNDKVTSLGVSADFLLHCLKEFLLARIPHGLVEVHGVGIC